MHYAVGDIRSPLSYAIIVQGQEHRLYQHVNPPHAEYALPVHASFLANEQGLLSTQLLGKTFDLLADTLSKAGDIAYPDAQGANVDIAVRDETIELVWSGTGRAANLNRVWTPSGDNIRLARRIARALRRASERLEARLHPQPVSQAI